MKETLNSTNCLNCGAELTGPICAQCGQKKALPISVKQLFKNFWTQLLELDFRVFHTIKMLAISPGLLPKNYIEGRRQPYTNPFKLLFFVSTFYFLVLTFFDVSASFSPEDKETSKAVGAFLNYLIYLFLAPTALFLSWIFKSEKYNWSECYVTVCYWWSGYLLIGSILAIALQFYDQYFAMTRVVVGLLYILFAINQMFSLNIIALILKTLVFYISYYLSTFLVMGIVITLAYLIQFKPLMIAMPK
ncbi:DUF3667 domain-containing protein [Aliikangiella marina]|uniref:DUF3667 domain-containing protein n=1 Tax=Aliikangiella marina TaxID=1712262 RepID=A0A545T165_9GAMM|nr:DUF3667 domain-containing protein [Aliikangiella marina]TQV70941.1 DUF3667 domain-containing protein [Aliikangiella marina]